MTSLKAGLSFCTRLSSLEAGLFSLLLLVQGHTYFLAKVTVSLEEEVESCMLAFPLSLFPCYPPLSYPLACIHAYTCVCVCAYTYIHTYIHTSRQYIYKYTHTHTHAYTHTHTHTHTDTHTRTHVGYPPLSYSLALALSVARV
jgi:hypothetical protein